MSNEEIIEQLKKRIEVLETFVLKIDYSKQTAKYTEIYKVVQSAFNHYFEVNICARERKKENVRARQMYYKYMRIHTGLSLYNISKTVGLGHDHSTIIHSLNEFDERVVVDRDYRYDWMKVNDLIKQKIKDHE